jgi:hypothetical protein
MSRGEPSSIKYERALERLAALVDRDASPHTFVGEDVAHAAVARLHGVEAHETGPTLGPHGKRRLVFAERCVDHISSPEAQSRGVMPAPRLGSGQGRGLIGNFLGWTRSLRPQARHRSIAKTRRGPSYARALTDGLRSGVECKSGWLPSTQAGLERPYKIASAERGQRSAFNQRGGP